MKYTNIDDPAVITAILDRIDTLRVAKGLTVSGLASEAGLSENTIKHMYKKRFYPSLATLFRICNALEITPAQFFSPDNDCVCLTEEMIALIHSYENLSKKYQELVRYIVNTLD